MLSIKDLNVAFRTRRGEVNAVKGISFDLKKGGYDRAELEKSVLGPTGNLRAPAMRMGKNWLVGFGEETYDEVFGK